MPPLFRDSAATDRLARGCRSCQHPCLAAALPQNGGWRRGRAMSRRWRCRRGRLRARSGRSSWCARRGSEDGGRAVEDSPFATTRPTTASQRAVLHLLRAAPHLSPHPWRRHAPRPRVARSLRSGRSALYCIKSLAPRLDELRRHVQICAPAQGLHLPLLGEELLRPLPQELHASEEPLHPRIHRPPPAQAGVKQYAIQSVQLRSSASAPQHQGRGG